MSGTEARIAELYRNHSEEASECRFRIDLAKSVKKPLPLAPQPARLAWVDNIRTAMVFLVVNMHACVTYSHLGGWYIKEPPEPPLATKIPSLNWQGHLRAFFMGLLFFLAGVFAHSACLRRGPARFIRQRLLRLGAPALLYRVVLHPRMTCVILREPDWPSPGELYHLPLQPRNQCYGSKFAANFAGCQIPHVYLTAVISCSSPLSISSN